MFEEQNQALEVCRFQLPVDAVKRMGDGMGDICASKVTLQRKDVVSNNDNIRVVLFGDSPHQKVNLAGVLWKIGCDLLTDKRLRQIADLEAAFDGVVIGDGDEIHPALDKLPMQLAWVGIAVWKIEPPKQPLLRARAEAGMNVEVTFAHIYLERPLDSLLRDPVLVGGGRSDTAHRNNKIDNLPPNGRVGVIGRMNA